MRAQTEDIPLESGPDDDSDFSLWTRSSSPACPPWTRSSWRSPTRSSSRACSAPGREGADGLVLRYGLEGQEPMTLKQVGDLIGLSRERVRQIETQALKKLKQSKKSKQLMGYLN